MAKHYTFNPHTLSYEILGIPFKVRIYRIALSIALACTLSTIAIYVFSHFFETPRAALIKQRNEELQMKYDFLLNRFRQTDDELNELMHRDNKVYRSIFEADPIPLSVREAGMGGVKSYEKLLANAQTERAAKALILMDKIMKKVYIQSKSFDEIIEYVRDKEEMIFCIPSIQPINISNPKVRFSSSYGWRPDPFFKVQTFHHGLDFAGPIGTPIYAAGSGKVEKAEFNRGGYGNMVLIDHGFGYQTRYAHLSDIKVQKGEKVTRGQLIGLLGNTGGRSTGPHLHYEVLFKKQDVNPINFFTTDISEEEYNKIIKALKEEADAPAMEY
ncbi:MAG: M23 family metallopeptidase [Prevotellaceae bacterium]|jgi:murein DD-endopeptidase MepM/ murein hydrolase activator NlpD|nr:M23 family metallopeptidase [Prevotellaceae bacterium]